MGGGTHNTKIKPLFREIRVHIYPEGVEPRRSCCPTSPTPRLCFRTSSMPPPARAVVHKRTTITTILHHRTSFTCDSFRSDGNGISIVFAFPPCDRRRQVDIDAALRTARCLPEVALNPMPNAMSPPLVSNDHRSVEPASSCADREWEHGRQGMVRTIR